jgi:hypothetical protein
MSRAKSKLAKDLEREKRRAERQKMSDRQKANFLFTVNCYHDEVNKDIVFTPESENVIFDQLNAEFKAVGVPVVWDNREYGEVLNRSIFSLPNVTVRFS